MKGAPVVIFLGLIGIGLTAWAVLAQAVPGGSLPAAKGAAAPTETVVAPEEAPDASGPIAGTEPIAGPAPQAILPEAQANGSAGPLEAAARLSWAGPGLVKMGRPADYRLSVRNTCAAVLQQVQVHVRTPAGMTVTATEPAGQVENKVITWDLGAMLPKQEKILNLRLVPDAKGIAGCHAWVTVTGATAQKIQVCEPKLVLKTQAPEKVMIGDTATLVLTVHNPGDGPAEQVKVQTRLSEGLEHAAGRQVEFDVGNLAPGETRSVQLLCATRAGGEQRCEVTAVADEGALRAQEQARVNVLMPRLELEAVGPKLRYLDRKAVYAFKVSNTGDAAANNVFIRDLLPEGFRFGQATDGGHYDFPTRTVSWFIGEVGPGQAKEVRLEVVAVNTGDQHHKLSAQAARGQKVEHDLMTRVEGLSEVLLKLADLEDPVEIGSDVTYQIRIQNAGSKAEANIRLACAVPETMQFKAAQGPTTFHEDGREIVFDPISALEPRAEVIYRVTVKSVSPGDFRFKAQISSPNLPEPVIEVEGTRVYQD